jgi:hypothetical protein
LCPLFFVSFYNKIYFYLLSFQKGKKNNPIAVHTNETGEVPFVQKSHQVMNEITFHFFISNINNKLTAATKKICLKHCSNQCIPCTSSVK